MTLQLVVLEELARGARVSREGGGCPQVGSPGHIWEMGFQVLEGLWEELEPQDPAQRAA